MESINVRCPFAGECQRKKCDFVSHELDCLYYDGNAMGSNSIADQENLRRERFRKQEEAMLEQMIEDERRAKECPPKAAEPAVSSGLVYLPIGDIHPHPDNPRKDAGDLSELADSIRENGILQNLTVTPRQEGDGYTVIIGHRRLAAARLAGLTELPCIVREMDLKEQVRTMLMENIQRSDLTMYEQAQGFQLMLDMGETVESIAKDSGFSQTTVRRRVKLLELDGEKFKQAEERGATLQDYLELDKIKSPELKNRALDAVGTNNFRNVLRESVETEEFQQKVERWEADLQKFAVRVEERNQVDGRRVPMRYVKSYYRWDTESKTVEVPEDAGKVRYYYQFYPNRIELYAEEKERVETEKERRRKAAREELKRREQELRGISRRHFKLRYQFVSSFSAAKKYMDEICRFAAVTIWDNGDADGDMVKDLLALSVDEEAEWEEIGAALKRYAANEPGLALLACAYAAVDHENFSYWGRYWNSEEREYEIVHRKNEELDEVYDFLTSIGYELSDEEQAMRDGSHPLLQREEGAETDG